MLPAAKDFLALEEALDDVRDELKEAAARYTRLRRHTEKTKTQIIDTLVGLNTAEPEGWKILAKVRDLLDSLTDIKNWYWEANQ